MDNYKRTNEILAEFRKMIEDDAELAAAVHKSGKLKSIRNFLQVSLGDV